jgi:hypothetical protein
VDPNIPPEEQENKLSLLIKQMGGVEVTVPISASEPLAKKIKKGSTAILVNEPGDPITPEVVYLKYCVRSICYKTAPLTPGLVQ